VRRLLALAALACASLFLSGCYVSDGLLLNPDAAAHPLDDGVYQRPGGGDDDKMQVSLRPDGWYDVSSFNPNGTIGESHRVLLNEEDDLGGRRGFVAAQEVEDGGYEYAVVFVEANGRVFMATPDCDDPADLADAVDHDGEAQDNEGMTHTCLFRSRAALVAALSAFAGHAVYGEPYQRH
jgi:hypothetical protein